MRNRFAIAALLIGVASSAFSQDRRGTAAPITEQEYGANVLRIAPVTAMDVGLGFGVGYERLLGSAQMIGLVFPVSILLENKNTTNPVSNSDHFNSPYNTYVYFTPGIKIYPFGQRKVTYAVGPSMMLGYGGGNEWQYRTDLYGVEYLDAVKVTKWRLGLLVNNYVNFQFSKHFNLGLDGGLGIRYLDKVSYTGSRYYAGNGDFNNGVDITGQFSLSLGYRF